ncbi:MAG: glycogen/starch synthase [Candidatus Marinimicrobia bacterium]|nr:glycogen/starch synthase [Candidatus Neomarinimicrobiota bacterium]
MSKRIYFLTSEIVPFAESYILSPYSKEVPNVFIENGVDFRVMMPKYGFISERRYILREVIRLRDMKLNFQGKEVDASVKSAFVPNTKVQVYFLENEDYYKPSKRNKLYSPESDENTNAIRFAYFSSAALATLNYLRWKPDVIVCNDWQMALLPMFLGSDLLDNEYFEDVKVVQTIMSKSDKSQYSLDEYDKIGLKAAAEDLSQSNELDAVAASIQLSDKVLFINHEGDLKKEYEKGGFKDVLDDNQDKISTFELENTNQEDWEELADEIDQIIEKI